MLALYVVFDGPTAATLELYSKATDESEDSEGSSSSGSVGQWAFHSEISVTSKGLIHVIHPLPADEYKVMVTAITGTGEVIIRESHSA